MTYELVRIVPACGGKLFLEFPWALTEIQGLDLPPTTYRTTRAPFQHGATLLDFVLEPRIVQIILHLRGHSRLDMWQKRQDIINVLNPLLGPYQLELHMGDGTIYSLHDVVCDGALEAAVRSHGGDATLQSVGIRMVAQDPVWYGASRRQVIVGPTATDELVLPAEFPIIFDEEGAVAAHLVIDVLGNWETYPIIEFYGPMSNPLVENVTIGEKLSLIYEVAAGEVVTIDTAAGKKSVASNLYGNLVGYLTTDSDLATFRLNPHPLAPDGENTLFAYGGACGVDTQFVVTWHDRYVGV